MKRRNTTVRGAAGGRCGAQTKTNYTKDESGFDYEVIDIINRHGNKSHSQIYRDMRRNKKLDDEFSGKAKKDARKTITLPHLKWMDRPFEDC